ncbi:hypothetical protein QCA50_002468 [Cerrena zonata]|uniref:Secreted protein n=1 Tax=Cerrena zonata TaxID=2478898 RepID=A0AAW0GNW0_9APHY
MVQAGLPLVAFLLFSSQTDVFRVWCFWKREKERVSPRASQQPETSHGGWSAPTDADHLSSSSGNAISTTQNDRPPTTGDGDVIIIGPLTHIYDSGSELKGGGLNDSGRYHHANMIRTDALPARKSVKYSKSLMTCCDL